jgi:hypothetical protein
MRSGCLERTHIHSGRLQYPRDLQKHIRKGLGDNMTATPTNIVGAVFILTALIALALAFILKDKGPPHKGAKSHLRTAVVYHGHLRWGSHGHGHHGNLGPGK